MNRYLISGALGCLMMMGVSYTERLFSPAQKMETLEGKQYIILEDRDRKKMEEQVNRKLSEGWTPVGGIATGVANELGFKGMVYTQAMIK